MINQTVMTNEIWKEIEGYGDRYMVSNFGRVKNCQRNKIMKTYRNRSRGYMEVSLTVNGKSNSVRVHRLVAIAFILKTGEEVNHIDGDKLNNHTDNLEWCNSQYNSEHAVGSSGKLISPCGEVHSFKGINRFCRENCLNVSSISKLLSGKIKQHHGWRLHE